MVIADVILANTIIRDRRKYNEDVHKTVIGRFKGIDRAELECDVEGVRGYPGDRVSVMLLQRSSGAE